MGIVLVDNKRCFWNYSLAYLGQTKIHFVCPKLIEIMISYKSLNRRYGRGIKPTASYTDVIILLARCDAFSAPLFITCSRKA